MYLATMKDKKGVVVFYCKGQAVASFPANLNGAMVPILAYAHRLCKGVV